MRNIWLQETPNPLIKMTINKIKCSCCNLEKETQEFSKNKKQCKACNIIKSKENKKIYQKSY